MQEYNKIIRVTQTEKIDEETGEITQETKTDKVIAGDPGEFFQVYASILGVIEKIKPIDAKVFISLFSYANSSNSLGLAKGMKQAIAKKNDIGYSTVANSITELVKANLLIRVSESFY